MSTQLSSYQIEFRDTLRRFFREEFSPEKMRMELSSGLPNPEHWKACETLGITSGFGGDEPAFGFRELGLLAFETGRATVPEPLLSHTVCCELSPQLLSNAGVSCPDDFWKTDGALQGALAFCSSKTFDSAVAGKSVTLSNVLFGDRATHVLLRDSATSRFAIVAVSRGKVKRISQDSIDFTQPLSEIVATGAPCVLMPSAVAELLECVCCMGVAATIAGVCSRVLEISKDFVSEREQFGVPVGGFQAVQHLLATAYTQSQALSALVDFSAWSLDDSRGQAALSSASALSYALEVGSVIVETAIQVHGGMGFTWEHELHFFLRRVKFWEAMYGGNSFVCDRVVRVALGMF